MSEFEQSKEDLISHEITVALEMLIKEDHDSIMKLRFMIPPPSQYPMDYILELNFSPDNPFVRPYVFEAEHFSKDTGHLTDSSRPRTYYALFRFMEFLREHYNYLERSTELLEVKFRHFRFRAKQRLDISQVDRREMNKNVQNTLIAAHNIISLRGHLESLYKKTLLFINTEIQNRGEFNLRKIYGSQTVESELYPDYGVMMNKVYSVILAKKRLARILDQMKGIRIPGEKVEREAPQEQPGDGIDVELPPDETEF